MSYLDSRLFTLPLCKATQITNVANSFTLLIIRTLKLTRSSLSTPPHNQSPTLDTPCPSPATLTRLSITSHANKFGDPVLARSREKEINILLLCTRENCQLYSIHYGIYSLCSSCCSPCIFPFLSIHSNPCHSFPALSRQSQATRKLLYRSCQSFFCIIKTTGSLFVSFSSNRRHNATKQRALTQYLGQSSSCSLRWPGACQTGTRAFRYD